MAKNNNKFHKRKQIFAIVCSIIIVIAFLTSIFAPIFITDAHAATSSSELKKQVENATKSKNDAKKQLDSINNKTANLTAEAKQIDSQINKAEDDIAKIEQEITLSEQNIAEAQLQLQEAEENVVEYDEEFKTRARTMYENGTSSYLEVILGASSFSDLITRIDIVKQIIEYDKEILNQLVYTKDVIAEAKATLEAEHESLESKRSQLELKMQELEIRLQEKEALRKQLEADKESYKKAYEAAEKEEKKLQQELNKLVKNDTSVTKYSGGAFTWPVPSSTRVTSPYGYRIHPILNTKKFHSGIDIGASYGASILAAAEGTVITATYADGYGKYIVINHGSGITTLYGHNSSLLVKVGDKVTKGQQIAKAGSTGMSTGNHLHFEVRVNGATKDPMSYFK